MTDGLSVVVSSVASPAIQRDESKTGSAKNQVRSLETKLAGKTWLQYQDALNLLRLFLDRWTYNEVKEQYIPFTENNLDKIAEQILLELFPDQTKALLLPERSRKNDTREKTELLLESKVDSNFQLTKPSGEVIMGLFRDSDSLMTISRARTVIGSDPTAAMVGFHNLMLNLYEIDQQDNRNRVLIWVIDMALRNDKDAARAAIYNVHFLAAQFRAIALIQRGGRRQLYDWLQRNVCVIVGSLSRKEIDQIYQSEEVELSTEVPDLPWFQSDRLFIESVPGRWLDTPGSAAFGRSIGDLWRTPTITAHLKLDDWELDHSMELDVRRNLRYFFHSEVSPRSQDVNEPLVRCIPLPEPGSRWSDAYRLAIQASFGRIKRKEDERLSPVRTLEALSVLRSQHFAALRLDEFLELPNFLIRAEMLGVSQKQH